ncbi:SDR family NAD(P)-dependent oxidoreductase [Dawidia soli]|uniref:SDR family oxidoreductase n=1 Tax=Dawidia soli TaxID=2782352 RepID=A0AAP2DDT0_9BACT|nr:SDR family oxidoreductase [Dawidia soli]MBT1689477.1 SDR family oxidoreductase [Dawidia soli]
MQLHNKNAVIYGAGGSLGRTVARTLAMAGARVFLTGHRRESVQSVADEIRTAGGQAEADVVDALNKNQIDEHLSRVIATAGSVDISFCLIDTQSVQDLPLIDMSLEDFLRPVTIGLQSFFLTATAAGKIMQQQRSGVILSLTATPGGIGYPYTGGFAPACTAMECFSQNLASELGAYGVRAVNIRSAGSPDSRVFVDAIRQYPGVMNDVLDSMQNDTMLKALPRMQDIANIALFLASDLAAMITGVTVDATAGTTAALNYRAPKTIANAGNNIIAS